MTSTRGRVLLLAVLTLAAAAVVVRSGVIHKSPEQVSQRSQAALERLVLPPGVTRDRTHTACPNGMGHLCVTSAASAAGLIDLLLGPLESAGLPMAPGCGDVLSNDAPNAGMPEVRTCATQTADGSVTLLAAEGALLPGTPRPATWAAITDMNGHQQASTTASSPEAVTAVTELLPARYRLHRNLSAGESMYDLKKPAGTTATAALAKVAERLLAAGFRVERSCAGEPPCRPTLSAQRYVEQGNGVEVTASERPDGSTVFFSIQGRDRSDDSHAHERVR